MERNIDEWVDYIQTLHHREIELTLDRVTTVYRRLFAQGISFKVISIAGTNGKGSTAELIRSMYFCAGYNVAKFTSPHLVNFNERYVVNNKPVDDSALLNAFNMLEAARQQTPLTFFECCTLLAIIISEQANVDIAVMEVGLGGRLDSVNILDADIAVVTNISIDHVNWLGDNVESIACEKIGIARSLKPCVIGMVSPPESMLDYCDKNKIPAFIYQSDFFADVDDVNQCWTWQAPKIDNLPFPYRQKSCQINNASVAIKAVTLLNLVLPVTAEKIRQGVANARLQGRCQITQKNPYIILDVAHNEASVARLAEFTHSLTIKGKIIAVCGMLSDKRIRESFSKLSGVVDEWHLATINNSRGTTAAQLQAILQAPFNENQQPVPCYTYPNLVDAYINAKNLLNSTDCLLVFGSFFVVSDIIRHESSLIS